MFHPITNRPSIEAVIELSTQVAEKEAQLALNQERLADFVLSPALETGNTNPTFGGGHDAIAYHDS